MTHKPSPSLPPVEPPSIKRLGIATVIAADVAAIVVGTTVLPAAYGVDPVGTGKALGLLDLYEASTGGVVEIPADAEPAVASNAAERPRMYKVDRTDFKIGPRQGFEYKYRLEQGAGMVYAWKATGRVNYEFHGEPQNRSLPVQSYEKSQNDFGAGSLTAPFTGTFTGGSGRTLVTKMSRSPSRARGYYSAGVELRPKFDEAKRKTVVVQIPHRLSALKRLTLLAIDDRRSAGQAPWSRSRCKITQSDVRRRRKLRLQTAV